MAFWSLILIILLALLLLGQIMAPWGDARLAVSDPRSDAADRRVFANDELVKLGLIQAISSLDKWAIDLCYACNLSR
jgi:hypothetical protein